MRIATASSTHTDPASAIAEVCAAVTGRLDAKPDWVVAFHTEQFDPGDIAAGLVARLGTRRLSGGTSCLGVMTEKGFASRDGVGLGVLAVSDPDGCFGVGAASMGDDPRGAASRALEAALADADRIDEAPSLIWLHAAPGHEELLLAGLADVVGPKVPVAGGSSADNEVAGRWSQFTGEATFTDAVVVSVLFPSVELSYAFHSGYDPTDHTGVVTAAEGRVLRAIDGEVAAKVYDRWTGGLLAKAGGGNVLASTTLAPIGREVGRVGGVPYYKLSHPNEVTADGGLGLFTEVSEGDEIVLLTGSKDSLVSRAGRVAQAALDAGDLDRRSLTGGLVIYCAGCMLTVRDQMDAVAESIASALGGAPFLGVFTFGEQGCFVGNQNSHGNLMISTVVFSDRPAG